MFQPKRPPDHVWVGASMKYMFWWDELVFSKMTYNTSVTSTIKFTSIDALLEYVRKHFNPHSLVNIRNAYDRYLDNIILGDNK